MKVIFRCPSLLIQAMVFYCPILPWILNFLSEIAADVNRLEVSNICHLEQVLSCRHFTNIFEQPLCVRHFSGCWLTQRWTMLDFCLHEIYIMINNRYYRYYTMISVIILQILHYNFIVQYRLVKRKSGNEQAKKREQNEEKFSVIVKFRTVTFNTTIVHWLYS